MLTKQLALTQREFLIQIHKHSVSSLLTQANMSLPDKISERIFKPNAYLHG